MIFLGLGDYLHSIAKQYSWQEHLQNLLVFCRTHVQRNFMKKFPRHPMTTDIMQLWEAESIDDLKIQMQIISSSYPDLKNWTKSKQKDWILAGLAQEKSKVPPEWWTFARSHTGISESSHFSDNNFTGRQLSLLSLT
jgi:beta-xylosidase